MATFNPDVRGGVDWDNDLFICYDTALTDALNRMHTGLSSNAGLVNLHWNYVRIGAEGSADSVTLPSEFTPYGLRLLRCVTGTLTGAGAYFGRAGGTQDFTVVNGQTYTVSVWVRVAVAAGVQFLFNVDDGTGGVDVPVTPTTTWQRVNATITAASTTLGFRIYKNGSTSNVTLDATGFMIVEGGNIPNGFNVGDPSNRYDNVTEFMESANWTIGRKTWANTMFDEGTCDITLRNDSRVFMPENTLSPLYDKMLQRRLMTLDTRSPGHTTWTRMFTGWTDRYHPSLASTTGQLQTTINCLQGRFQLDSIQYNKTVSGTQTADEVIRNVILSGFTSAATPYQVILDTSLLSACYFVNPDDILELDTGVSDIPTTGDGWGGDVNATRVITDVNNIERGFVFIDRSGVVKFYNRYHYHDPALSPATIAINLDTDATERNYVYGEGYQNVVRVTYRPSGSDSGVIWTSKEPIEVESKDIKTIDVKFEHQQSRQKITVSEIAAFGDAEPDSTYTTSPTYSKPKTAITYALENGRAKLTINNFSRQLTLFDIVLRGSTVESFGGTTVERSEDVRGGKITMNVDSRQLTEENDAINLGDYLLDIHDRTAGEFRTITIKSKNHTWFSDILNTGIGSKVNLTETQTGHDQDYYIISEAGTWLPGVGIDLTLGLYPLFRTEQPWVLGTSVLGTDTILGY